MLFVCTHNSARSQIAEAWLRHLGGHRFDTHSAGSEATAVRPEAIQAMAEAGVDISRQRSKRLEEYRGRTFDAVITVCDQAAETCPVFPGGGVRLHWPLPDPSQAAGSDEERMQVFRDVRDRLRRLVAEFIASHR